MRDYIQSLIIKYVNHAITIDELDILIEALENPLHSEDFYHYVIINYATELHMSSYNIENAKKELLSKIKEDKKAIKQKRIRGILSKIAASILLILGVVYMFNTQLFKNTITDNENITTIEGSENAITLELDNGDVKIITEKGEETILNKDGIIISKRKGTELLYERDVLAISLSYNTLTIPYGKKFQLTLSDGTQVHLNAGSSLKYPTSFIEGMKREVYLQGEAYFDVTADKNHPFIVHTGEVYTNVLGTSFNVSYYPEDIHISMVLVEGAIVLENAQNKSIITTIHPGEKAAWDKTRKNVSVSDVDTKLYTEWRHGHLRFKSTPFRNIKRMLERNFNIKIENQYSILDNQIYTASFFSDESIEDILGFFKEDTNFNFIRKDDVILITPPK